MCSLLSKRSFQAILLFSLIAAWLFVIFTLDSDIQDDPVHEAFRARRELVKRVCLKFQSKAFRSTKDVLLNRFYEEEQSDLTPQLTPYQMEHLLVDHKHQVMYCYVPKVGCTNWKRIFLMLRGDFEVDNPLDIKAPIVHERDRHHSMIMLNVTEQKRVLKDYRKFLFVRHPFERLLSAYRDKFESNKTSAKFFHERIGRIIIKDFRKNPTKEALESGTDVSFLEFIQYLMSPKESLHWNTQDSYNEHWEPMTRLCNPCAIAYDYIGRYDDIVEESNVILEEIDAEDIKFPSTEKVQPANTWELMRRYYDEIPLKFIRVLEEIYKMDLLLFNYTATAALQTDF